MLTYNTIDIVSSTSLQIITEYLKAGNTLEITSKDIYPMIVNSE